MRLHIFGLAIALAAGGCRERPLVIEEAVGPQYSANRGLFLPDETRRSIDLQVVEVGEQKGSGTLEFEVRVYAREGNVIKASGALGIAPARLLKAGQSVAIQTRENGRPATTSPAFTGKVVGVSEQLRAATGHLEVLVELAAAPESIVVGSVLSAQITLQEGEKVITIPKSALLQCTEGSFVFAVSGEHFVRTAVKAGGSHGEVVEISDGLLPGDEVVARPVMSLWLTELAAVKGGQACCIEPPKGK